MSKSTAIKTRYVTLWDTATREIIKADSYVDHYEDGDPDPETGKRAQVLITAEDAASVRARCLVLHAEDLNRSGAHAQVVIGDAPFGVPADVVAESAASDSADESADSTTEEAANA